MRKLAAVALAMTLALCGCGGGGGNSIKRTSNDEASDMSERFVSDDGTDYFTTVTDTETNVVYLVWTHGSGKYKVGGITPLLETSGKPTTAKGRE